MKTTITILIIFLLSSSLAAFDGKRDGFIIGGGLGFAPLAMNSFDKDLTTSATNKHIGMSRSLFIGFGITENNLLTYGYNNIRGESQNLHDRLFMQHYLNVSWYHYFNLRDFNCYTILGFGWTYYDIDRHTNFEEDYGYSLGVGTEIIKHIQVNFLYTHGQVSDRMNEYNQSDITIQVNAIAY